MSLGNFQLAQVNIAMALADFDDPIMTPMVSRIAEINLLAEQSKGFVWRFKTAEGDLTYLRPFDDGHGPFVPERFFFNMSVWESIEDLRAYVFASRHVEFYRRRKEWLASSAAPNGAMWWIRKGNFPSVEEAKARLDLIRQNGSTPEAFDFKNPFRAPEI